MATGTLGDWPHLGYTGFDLDRASERRGETPAFLRHPGAKACLMAGDTMVLAKHSALDALFDLEVAAGYGGRTDEACLLGLATGGAPRFALPLHAAALAQLTERDDLLLTDLRSLAVEALIPPDQLGLLATGKAMLAWHARRTFCSNCGERLAVGEGGWRRDCPNCGAQHFPRTDPVVIMLVTDGDDCLLGRSPRFAPGMWSALAGFVEPGETFEAAVRREVKEEAAIETGAVRYLASQPWPFPMSIMIGMQAQALSRDITIDANELEGARWFSREEAALMLARTHPDGLVAPVPMAIAHHLIRAFVEGRDPPAG
ncbi:NAD(+) diphosphatase [Starkeya sp. ORNL1]|uniref:NAD(+) diphosphatase n=1 Tax=Starkeya sp. ORNL1 TaxID=2709380 RepID=UPI001462BD22|nr:NAD(+) diphosphatase [Starkeya sp. ORNL1]QJP15289.1 NAD(+) diphosphatase [Starkeya sp. ORNL1]